MRIRDLKDNTGEKIMAFKPRKGLTEAIENYAKDNLLSKSEVIRRALNAYLHCDSRIADR